MSQNLRNYVTAIYGIDHVLRQVADTAWDLASPCEGWSVRDVTGHAIGVVSNVGSRCGYGELVDVFSDNPARIAGENPYASWYEIRQRVLEALDQPGSLQVQIESAMRASAKHHLCNSKSKS